MIPSFDMETNVLIVTLDSCRWDSFNNANCKNLLLRGAFYKAYANGTYTLPAHISMYNGKFPNVLENIPYYNRYSSSLFRLDDVDDGKSYCTISKDKGDIVKGFSSMGYKTVLIAAVKLFNHPLLNSSFRDYFLTGICLEDQIRIFVKEIDGNEGTPFFCLLNIGETHDPYLYKGKIPYPDKSRARRMNNIVKRGYEKCEHQKQIDACSYIDEMLSVLIGKLDSIARKTLVIVCGDHGECFGEDNLYGHGFYHPKIFEVPLGIFMTKHE